MILSIDGSAGVSGDRLLAALVDAGLPVASLERLVSRLPIPPVRLVAHRHPRERATALELVWSRRPAIGGPRRASVIVRELTACSIPSAIKRQALAVFRRLIGAEASVHRCLPSRVRLHQLSAPDTLITIVGVCAALAHFRITQVVASPLLIGARYQDHAGRWRARPGPAMMRLTQRWPVWRTRAPIEYTTPTGAALVTALARPATWRSPLRVVAEGRGACVPLRRGLRPVTVWIARR